MRRAVMQRLRQDGGHRERWLLSAPGKVHDRIRLRPLRSLDEHLSSAPRPVPKIVARNRGVVIE